MQWAEFIDKNGDINDPKNYIQGSLQRDKPNKHQIGEYWEQNHPNWREVSDSFIPPAPVLTKTEIYANINTTYSTRLSNIITAIQMAEARGDTVTVAKQQANYTATQAEWKQKIKAV